METADLIKKVRKIEIKSKGLSNQIFSGEYHSAFKGRGMAFSEVREYQPGDEIRLIDWNVTARFNAPFIKVFQEERELSVMLVVDASDSQNFGSNAQLKRELITELCAVVAFSASKNNDKIGIIFFSDKVEKYIPPKKGKTHVLRIIRELIEFTPENKGTDVGVALKFLTNVIKKKSITFVLSDFVSNPFDEALKIAAKKHDLIAVKISDGREQVLPNVGLIKLMDGETGKYQWLDTSSKNVRMTYAKEMAERNRMIDGMFSKSSVDMIQLETGKNYIVPLINFFKKREGKR
jgi:uncharacterized protein (DUF58 family)